MRRHRVITEFLVALLAICTAACSGGGGIIGGGNSPPSTDTPIPATPTPDPALVSQATGAISIPGSMSTISLGSFQAAALATMQSGLVLTVPTKSSSGIGTPSLAFTGFSGGTPKTFANATTAPDGHPRTISSFTTGGAWVVYVQQEEQGQSWELWAVNPSTGDKHLIDSADKEQNLGILASDFATDGTDVVWAVPLSSQNSSLLRAYNLASGTTRTLVSLPGASFSAVLLVNRLLYYQTAANSASSNKTTSWLWLLTQPKGAQITIQPKGTLVMNSRYLAWYDADAGNLMLYDIITGKTTSVSENACENAVISLDRPFMACLDDVDDQYQIIRVPTGTNAAFGVHATGGFGGIMNGKVYWVPEPNPLGSNNVVDYFALPTT